MTQRALRLAGTALSLLCGTPVLRAQQAPPDSVFRRAQRLANDGSSAAARALLDSLVQAAAEGSDARADALFWRATVVADSQSAQMDYLTIVVDHAVSPRAADALLRVGRYELDHSDRDAARRHFERLVLEHAASPAATDGWYWLGRVRILDNDLPEACVALDSALSRVPEADIERRRPVQYYSQLCRNLPAPAPVPARDSSVTLQAARDSTARDSTARAPRADSTPAAARRDTAALAGRGAAPAKPKYSVQVAAYDSRAGADALAKRLITRGYQARVDSLKLFHVRIGSYVNRADAVALVNKLKQQGQTAIVVEVERREP